MTKILSILVVGACLWATVDMIQAYCRLFKEGYAHSGEAWAGGELVGGVYGVSLGGCFFAESMYTLRPNASKVALVALVRQLDAWKFDLVDCQLYAPHLARFGATQWTRTRFLKALERSVRKTTRKGRWKFGEDMIRERTARSRDDA